MADLDMLKEIPGYKLILKSVLKSQIQLLLEQLSDQTGEESIILTASVHDGSLSHLGSCTGKGFLEGREEIKSQFLGYCLKTHHRAKTSETRGTPYQRSQPHKKSRVQSTYLGSQQSDPSSRYTSQNSPNSSFDSGGGGGSGGGPLQLPSFSGTDSRYGIDNNSVEMKGQIRTSPDLSDHDSSVGQIKQEPSSTPVLPVSTSLSSGLAQGYSHDQSSSHSVQQDSESEIDTQNIKIEADEENEEELEITGVEMVSGATPENWGQRAGLGPSTQESGLELDMPDQADYRFFRSLEIRPFKPTSQSVQPKQALSSAERTKRWRNALKKNPEKYENYKKKEIIRKKLSRESKVLTEEEKEKARASSRARQKKYREKRKLLGLPTVQASSRKMMTRKEREKQREYWRQKKREHRNKELTKNKTEERKRLNDSEIKTEPNCLS